MRRKILCAFIALLSAGWLMPMWLGVSTYLNFWQAEALPLLDGRHPGNSFPFLQFTQECFAWGFAWLAIAIAFWAWIGCSAVLRARGARLISNARI